MNKYERQRRINEALSYMRISNKGHLNCIRLNPSCSKEHNNKIIELCLGYLYEGVPFVTEAIFKNGSRCDILLPATFDIIEVLHTETDERFSEKIKNYPSIFKITKIRTNNEFQMEWN